MEPYEIIMAPYTVYIAPVGESFPAIDATPAGNWATLGLNGTQNMSTEGVTVAHSQTLAGHKNAGSTGDLKVSRTEEAEKISLILEDMTAETYAKVMNNQTVTTTAATSGAAGYKSIPLYMGQSVSTFALLVKGVSPFGDGFYAQYQVPVCYQSGNPSPTYTKGGTAALAVEFSLLEDPNAASESVRFGNLIDQTASATGE